MNTDTKRGFLVRQRAFLKLYLMKMIHENKKYGTEFMGDLDKEFKPYGYSPTHSEIYKTLHELTRENIVRREKKLRGEPGVDFQEIIIYHLTDKGKEEYDLYRKQMKVELDRCVGLLQKAISDHYGPIKKK
ncbi:helix-turn-helix transcriptional regulator [Cytobacillus horneckiae]|uniref:helix-turn-helix transcriptional regulator n=1 Tax=Cytobacillus horneckiae TaxID=549687 RepID=UPI0034CD3B46